MDGERRLVLLAVNRITCLLPRDKHRLAGSLRDCRDLEGLDREALARIVGKPLRRAAFDPRAWVDLAREDDDDLTSGRLGCTFYAERTFPGALRQVHDPPLVLYHRGKLPDPGVPVVAVVGTRRASAPALRAAWELGAGLARAGVSVVSGLARGIDSAAHEGSLQGGSRGIAVLGNGIDRLYPPSSAPLGRRILASGGCVLSEYPPGTPPLPHQFPARNRVIAGMAGAVVVVQAPRRSGALITADFALQDGREVFVHEVGTEGERGEGTRSLADSGAAVVRGAAEVLGILGIVGGTNVDRYPPDDEPGSQETDVGLKLARELERELLRMDGEERGRT